MATYNVEVMAVGTFSKVIPVTADSLVEALREGMKIAEADGVSWTMDDVAGIDVKEVAEYSVRED